MSDPYLLTADFFQTCLQSQEEEPIRVTSVEASNAVSDGNNFGSQIFRVNVKYNKSVENHSVSLIVKIPISNMEDYSDIYDKEDKFYRAFVNATYKYYKHEIVPKHYSSPNRRFIVLEDLTASGYKMVDRRNFLDLDHCQLFITASAKLHALSWAVYKDNPEIIKSVLQETPSYTENNAKMVKTIYKGGMLCMAAFLENMPDCKEYVDVIKEVIAEDKFWQIFQEIKSVNSSKHLKALVQLDPWSANMMFKYDNLGKVESVKKFDYQLVDFTSPLQEIVIFLAFSTNLEVREGKWEYLYRLYCDTLNDNLAGLGCAERLNFEDMKADVLAMSPLVLFILCSLTPISLAEEAIDYDEYSAGTILNRPVTESTIYKIYQGATFKKCYPQFLHYAAKEGVFDYLKRKMEQL